MRWSYAYLFTNHGSARMWRYVVKGSRLRAGAAPLDSAQATIDAWYAAFQTAEVIQGGRTCGDMEAMNQALVEHRFSFTWHGIVVFSMRDDGCGEYSVSSGGLVNPYLFRGLSVTPRMYPHAKQPVPLLPPDPGQTPQP